MKLETESLKPTHRSLVNEIKRKRRERIATAALQGLLAGDKHMGYDAACETAVEAADTLIKYLDRKNERARK